MRKLQTLALLLASSVLGSPVEASPTRAAGYNVWSERLAPAPQTRELPQSQKTRWLGTWRNGAGQLLTVTDFDGEMVFSGPGGNLSTTYVSFHLGDAGCQSRKFSADGSKFMVTFSGCGNANANLIVMVCTLLSDTQFRCSGSSIDVVWTKV